MFIASSTEFNRLRNEIKTKQMKSVTEVRNYLEVHFQTIEWSLLKEEWNRLDEQERTKLAQKLFEEP